MNPTRSSFLLTSLLASFAVCALAAPPIPAPDSYSVAEDTTLTVPAATGLLLNDNPNGNPQIEAAAVTQPLHGSLVLNGDGSFSFVPAANYNGPDAFTYKARKFVGPLTFNIVPAQSNVNVQITVHISGINQTRSDSSSVGGTVTLGTLEPKTTGPFNLAQVTGINAVLLDALELHYSVFLVGTADITAAPGAISISMVSPGAPAPVDGAGRFTQTGNTVNAGGIVHVKYNILLGGSSDSDETLDADSVTDFTNASVTSDGTTITLVLPIDIVQNGVVVSTDPAVTADIHITGTMRATAPAIDNFAEESGPTNVSIDVTPVNDPPAGVGESYIARESTAMTIPASVAQSTEELVASGAVWKYRYDGQNLGTAWKEWLYNDSGWASGPAQLGFGDPEIVTNIRPGATPNYVTAYFRRAFVLNNLSNTRPGLKLYVKRDDAAAVYLNGVEVYRDAELPAGAAFDTYATAQRPDAEENVFVEVPLSRSLLFEGVNVLAAEVHQVTATSSDLRWDGRLTRELGAPGVLANDTDIDSPPSSLLATVLRAPLHGQLQLSVNGGFIYTPNPGHIGGDNFIYRVSDGAAPPGMPITLLARGSVWKYLADGTDQGIAWRAPAFDDLPWPSGPAELGYGDAGEGRPEATNIRPDTVNTPVYPTYYFRTHANIMTDLVYLGNVRGRILRDDAAAVYLNGVEVYRDPNLAAGALFSDYATAGTPSETDYAEFAVPASALVQGDNVIAVEVHQASATSSDVSFDFELVADALPGAQVSINVLNDDVDLDGMSDTWERANGLNYLSAADAVLDADHDGKNNREEFLAGTDPRNPTQYLRASSVTQSGGNLLVGFAGTVAGRSYQVECSNDLTTWVNFGSPVTAAGSTLSVTIPIGAETKRFYRLRVLYTFP